MSSAPARLSRRRISPPARASAAHRIQSWDFVVATALLVALGFFFLQIGLQWLIYVDERNGHIHWATGAVSAAAIGVLSFRVLYGIRKSRIANRARFVAIGEANHHIRNALHAMQLRFYVMGADRKDIEELLESVRRIRWVLDEVLPEEKH